MRKCWGKRGNLIEFVLSPMFRVLIVIVLVFLPLLYYTSSVGKSTYFEREFISRDVGLMIEALHASPNDAYIDYNPQKTGTRLQIKFSQDSVQASEYSASLEKALSKSTAYTIFGSKVSILETTLTPKTEVLENKKELIPYRMSFVKTKSQIIPSAGFANLPAADTDKACDALLQTFDGNWQQNKMIYIDTYSTDDNSFVFAASVCEFLSLNDNFFSVMNACDEKHSLSQTADALATEKPDMMLILYANSDASSKNNVNIYYVAGEADSAKSSKLGCMMQAYFKDTGIKYDSYSKSSDLPQNLYQLKPIITGRPALIIEIGNMNNLKDTDAELISKAIYRAVSMYYET